MNNNIETLRLKKRAWLTRYAHKMDQIKNIERRIQKLEDRTSSAKSPNYSGMPRGGTPITTADLIVDKVDLEELLKEYTLEAKQLRREIIDVIDTADYFSYIDVLEDRYIKLKPPKHNERYLKLFDRAIDYIEIPGI